MLGAPQLTLALHVNPPLVEDLGNGKFNVDPRANELRLTFMELSKLAFLFREGPESENDAMHLMAKFMEQGWVFTTILGKTGEDLKVKDQPGFVVRKGSTIIVVLRGTNSTVPSSSGDTGLRSADWKVNFDYQLIDTPHGKFHRGFWNKANAALPSLEGVLKKIISSMSASEKANLKIWFTGHSMGAALGPLLAALIVEWLKSSHILEPEFMNFDNLTDHIVSFVVFSAPRFIGNNEALKWFNSTVGENEGIRQNVLGDVLNDPVAVASLGVTSTAALQTIPLLGRFLAEAFGGGSEAGAGSKSVGRLAGDKITDLHKRMTPAAIDEYAKRVSKEGLTSIPKNIVALIKEYGVLAHYGGTFKKLGSESSVAKDERKNVLTSVFAMEGAPAFEILLHQGYEYQKKTGTGVKGAVRRGIEKVAEVKMGVEQAAECVAVCNRNSCKTDKTFEYCQKRCHPSSIKNCTAAHEEAQKAAEGKKAAPSTKATVPEKIEKKAVAGGPEVAATPKMSLAQKAKCLFCTEVTCKNQKTFEDCEKTCPRTSIPKCTKAHEEAQKAQQQKMAGKVK